MTILDLEVLSIRPVDEGKYQSVLERELEAAKLLVEAEAAFTVLESRPAIKKYKNSQVVANAHGIGQCIFEWRAWVESMNPRKTPQSDPAFRLRASSKTLPEGCIFEEAEIEEVRECLKAKQAVTIANDNLSHATSERCYLLKKAVVEHSQESAVRGYPSQTDIAAKQYTEVALT